MNGITKFEEVTDRRSTGTQHFVSSAKTRQPRPPRLPRRRRAFPEKARRSPRIAHKPVTVVSSQARHGCLGGHGCLALPPILESCQIQWQSNPHADSRRNNLPFDLEEEIEYTSAMPRYPWTYRLTPRRPRRLTWYSVITQAFTLLGRLVGRAATGSVASTPRKTTTRRRRS